MSCCLNGEALPMYRPIPVKEGDVFTSQMAVSGLRGYMAFSGGIDVPVVMGSRSTNIKCRTGGFCGRALQAGGHGRVRTRHGRHIHAIGFDARDRGKLLRLKTGDGDERHPPRAPAVLYRREFVVVIGDGKIIPNSFFCNGRFQRSRAPVRLYGGSAKRLVAALVSDGSLSEEDVAELSAMFRVADDE